MEEQIKQAIKLLKENGYVVKRWTRAMDEDAKECEEMAEKGLDKDCCGYACAICLCQ